MTNKKDLSNTGKNILLAGSICLEGLLEGAVIGSWADLISLFKAGKVIRDSLKKDTPPSFVRAYSASFYVGEAAAFYTASMGITYLI